MKKNPLLDAVFGKNLEDVREVLEWEGDPDPIDRDGRSPLFRAITQGNLDIVNFLIEAGANVNLRDRAGKTPLHFTAIHLKPDMAKILLLHGAEVDAQDAHGNTSLWNAVYYSSLEDIKNGISGKHEIIDILLAGGADKFLKNYHDVSPADLQDRIKKRAHD